MGGSSGRMHSLGVTHICLAAILRVFGFGG
jgi:hypothetical protein